MSPDMRRGGASSWSEVRARADRGNPETARFIFATGIECSYPKIAGADGRDVRLDELELCDHYGRWREDLELTRALGLRYLRYGPPYYRMHLGPGRYDWSWTDQVVPELERLGITPIMDLCHFGVPDWLGSFQNRELPRFFAEYAEAFAARYPDVRLYTPMNEMYIAAKYSALTGWWNERLSSDRAFVTALGNIVRANVEAMRVILRQRPDALFIQSESSEYTHSCSPCRQLEAERTNEQRFLSLDLNYGVPVSADMYRYLVENGMSDADYRWFQAQDLREHCVMGNDYYANNEHLLLDEGAVHGEVLGYASVTRDYYRRYNLPVMHTETNKDEPGAEEWLWRTWANIQRLRRDGVPLCGMTWYSLTDQIDWDDTLRTHRGTVNPRGLYDLDRKLRPAGRAYKELVECYGETPLLPNGPLTLTHFHEV